MVNKRYFKLVYPYMMKDEPIIYKLVKDYNLVPNIRCANSDQSTLCIELEGPNEAIQSATTWMKSKGIEVTENAITKKRVHMVYPKDLGNQPVLYRLIKDFNLMANLCNPNEREACNLTLDLEGESSNVQAALTWAKDQGIQVKENK